jgi:hypothetical protein
LCSHAGDVIELQEQLLAPHFQALKPSEEFLGLFAGVVGSKWPSLAASLSLKDADIEEVKKEEGSAQNRAFKMLMMWRLQDSATHGQLCQTLKKISIFQHN